MEMSEMLNIQCKNIEEEICKAIAKVKEELDGLNIERTCKIYSSYVLRELHNRHIVARIINTKSVDLNYEHEFVMATDGKNNYIIDLTYRQFGQIEPQELNNNGFIKCTQKKFYKYINAINSLNSHKKK